MTCPKCNGGGWVCEDHPDLPWNHNENCGAGMPCSCGRDLVPAEMSVIATTDPEAVKKWSN